jgi:hypothetical protein
VNNPPAFPTGIGLNADKTWIGSGSDGMTLRDYFAAKAMQGLLSDPDWRIDLPFSATASAAYKMADAMLEARNEPQ